ncbi:kinase-like protein [Panus rudis PR-1116 ss-1]|nr:kinase-like protein [Panus rudis PR-1116 ss-1]
MSQQYRPPPAAERGRKTRSLRETFVERVGSFLEAQLDRGKLWSKHRSEPLPLLESQLQCESPIDEDNSTTAVSQDTHPDANLIQMVKQAMTCPIHKDSVLALRGEPAADIISLMQKMLDDPVPYGMEIYRRPLRRLLIRLSREARILPASLFLGGVVCQDRMNPFGGGGFADIFPADLGGARVALKRLRVFQISTDQEAFFREALVWRQLRHPYILPFWGVDRISFRPHLCMVSPFMENGNIIQCSKRLAVIKADIPREPWLLEVAKGLAYLHQEQVIHGDLRGANILIDEDLHVRLSDFGLASLADANPSSGFSSCTGGSPRWSAPEVLRGGPSTFESDVYAFGIFCIELYTMTHPFPYLKDAQVLAGVLRGARPRRPGKETGIHNYVWRLAKRCWSESIVCRPNTFAIVKALAEGTKLACTSDNSSQSPPPTQRRRQRAREPLLLQQRLRDQSGSSAEGRLVSVDLNAQAGRMDVPQARRIPHSGNPSPSASFDTAASSASLVSYYSNLTRNTSSLSDPGHREPGVIHGPESTGNSEQTYSPPPMTSPASLSDKRILSIGYFRFHFVRKSRLFAFSC